MSATDVVFLIAVVGPLALFVAATAATMLGATGLPELARFTAPSRRDEAWPRVSCIVPACDEEDGIEQAMRAMLAPGYPDTQVVAVDDRSTDGTGRILDQLAAEDPRLTTVHIDALPEGWLGKLNALQKGVERSDGAWLLFADADANLAPGALKKAIAWAEANELDFLSLIPKILSAGFLGDAVFNVMLAMFCIGSRPWRVRSPHTTTVAATGAFMLVRRSAFQKTPGFDWLKLEVADDFGLCHMMKTHGGRCDILRSGGEVTIRWYSSLGEMTRKMQKNFFAVTGRFSLGRILVQALLCKWLCVFPMAAMLPGSAPWRWALLGAALVAQVVMTITGALWARRPVLPSLVPAAAFGILAFMMMRAGILGRRLGGIAWRGVVYPTQMLKDRQRVRV